MSQVTIYVDDATEAAARAASAARGIPLSRFVTEAVQLALRAEWPEDVLASFGDWAGEPADLFDRAPAPDLPREPL